MVPDMPLSAFSRHLWPFMSLFSSAEYPLSLGRNSNVSRGRNALVVHALRRVEHWFENLTIGAAVAHEHNANVLNMRSRLV
jgi:hypothetical protein